MYQPAGIYKQYVLCDHGLGKRSYIASDDCKECNRWRCYHHQGINDACHWAGCDNICVTCDKCLLCECYFTCGNHKIVDFKTLSTKPGGRTLAILPSRENYKHLSPHCWIERILALEGTGEHMIVEEWGNNILHRDSSKLLDHLLYLEEVHMTM